MTTYIESGDARKAAEWGANVSPVSDSYERFLSRKQQRNDGCGVDPIWMPDSLFAFQSHLVEWSLRMGRSAIFADCGLGKTYMQLVWAQNVVQHTNQPVLILTPLAVAEQTQREAAKFGIEATVCRDGKHGNGIVLANYERLHYFSSDAFAGVVCDESSILKNFSGKIKAAVTEFMRPIRYRLLCTATAAPNDFHELGTSSEALGYLGYQDMLSRFFKEDIAKDHLGWGRKTYRFRGHAEVPFWRWVCSWARACRTPSDLGYADDGFILPELCEREYVLESSTPRDGYLFSVPARDLREQRNERKVSIQERCEVMSELACNHRLDEPDHDASVLWCHLNDEGDLLEKLLPDALQVSGSMPVEQKEERLLAFQSGDIPILITKPKIGCYGLNWQHCNSVMTFASHSYEQYYQLVRRCYRFGQERPVTVTTVTTEGEAGVLANLQRKSLQAERMFSELTSHINEAVSISTAERFTKTERMPTWL